MEPVDCPPASVPRISLDAFAPVFKFCRTSLGPAVALLPTIARIVSPLLNPDGASI